MVSSVNQCPNCGGTLIGDGYASAVHCEHVDPAVDIEPDGGPVYCEEAPADAEPS